MPVIAVSSPKITLSGGVNPTPTVDIVHGTAYLAESGGNTSMDVNGASTPRIFFAEVPSGQTWYVSAVGFYFSDNQIKDRNDFGDVSGLTNGLLTEFDIGGTDYEHSNIRNNMELGLIFPPGWDSGDGNNGLAADKPAYFGRAEFGVQATTLSAGDQVKVTVRDNLNGLDDMRMHVEYWRVVP